MFDDFREWLSDNLRYFELGGAILLVLFIIIFSVRACAGRSSGKSGKDTAAVKQSSTGKNAPVSEEDDASSSEIQNPMVAAASDIQALIEKYYTALGNRDVVTLRTLVDDLSPTDEPQIANSVFEKHHLNDAYTKNGLTDNAEVVYADYTYQVQGFDTALPATSWLYLQKDSDGNWKIKGNADEDREISSFISALNQDADVVSFLDANREAYNKALASDPALAKFMDDLGQPATATQQTASDGTILTVLTESNVRSSPSTDSGDNIIGQLSTGDTVRKTGDSGDWVQIEYDGQTAYIHKTLVSASSQESSSSEAAAGEDSSSEADTEE
jgi:hypothetical protein